MDIKKLNRIAFQLGLMGFLANGDIYAAAPLLVNIAKDLHIGVNQAALSITSYMLSFGIFTLIFGPLSDRIGKARIIILASFGTAVFSFFSGMASNITFLTAMRFLKGAFASGIMPVSMAIVGELYDDSKRQSAVAQMMGMMTLGGAAASIIGGGLSYIASWRSVYFVYGLAELITAFCLLFILDRKSSTVQYMNYPEVYGKALKNKKLLGVLLVVFLTGFCIFGSYAFGGELLEQKTNLNILIIGLILSFFGIGGITGSRIASITRQKAGNKICIISGIFGSCALISLASVKFPVLFALVFLILGVSFIFLHSTMITEAQNTIPAVKGTIMAMVSFCVFVGSGLGTIVNKQVMESSGISVIFAAAAALFVLTGLFAFIAAEYKSKKNLIRS